MVKAINIREFEHTFRSEILKKGFSLFKNNRISSIEKKERGTYIFKFEKPEEKLEIKKSGEKITAYSCSCGQLKCRHLCAAIFYFQKELFGDLALVSNLKLHNEGHRLFAENCKFIKEILGASLTLKGIKNNVVEKTEIHLQKQNATSVYFHLAMINEISFVFSAKFAETEPRLNTLLLHAKNELRRLAQAGLDKNERSAWIQAAKKSISGYRRFNSKQFAFLLPYASSFIKDKEEVDEFKEILQKRKLNVRFPSEPDLKLMATVCLDLCPVSKGKKQAFNHKNKLPEEYMGLAEMAFCQNKKENALKILTEGLEHLKIKKPASFTGYLDFAIEKAREIGDSKKEIEFLENLIIYDSYISPLHLLRIKELLNKNQRMIFADNLINTLEKKGKENFNKIADLLLSEGRYDDLISKIAQQENKFRLLNTVMLEKLPAFDEKHFAIYTKHFKQAVTVALETHYQEHVFNSARPFIDKLPENSKSKLLRLIIAETGKHSYLGAYILKCYPSF